MDKETLLIRKILFTFLALCFLIISVGGSFHVLNIRLKGIQAEGRIVSFERFIPYDSYNRLQAYKYRIKIQFKNPEGQFQIQDAVLSWGEKQDFHAELGTQLPFWYVPATGQYSIGKEPPGLGWVIIPNLILIPAAIALIFFAFSKKR